MVRAILFDAVGTLIHPDPPVAAAYSLAGRRFGVVIDENELGVRFRSAFARQEEIDRGQNDLKSSAERERERWREIVSDVFADAIPSLQRREELFYALWNYFARPQSWRTYDDVDPCWQALESCRLTIAIASNFDDRIEHIVQQIHPLNRVARLYVSARIGHRKPSAEFYRAIERDLGLPPDALLSVGDDLDNDYRGAEAAGWRAILVDRSGTGRSSDVDTITSLTELARYI